MLAMQPSIPLFDDVLFRSAVNNFGVLMPKAGSCRYGAGRPSKEGKVNTKYLDSTLLGLSQSFRMLNRLRLVLLPDFKITHISILACELADDSYLYARNSEMGDILAVESKALWDRIKRELSHGNNFKGHLQLMFCSSQGFRVPALCTITWERVRDLFILEGLIFPDNRPTKNNEVLVCSARQKSYASVLYHYILKRIDKDEPLPPTSDLARMFGTNERTLKKIFRQDFGTSIYQFYTNEKLRRVRLLIEHSSIPLYKIAADLGYGDYSTFFKAFYKKYGFSPSDLKRWDRGIRRV